MRVEWWMPNGNVTSVYFVQKNFQNFTTCSGSLLDMSGSRLDTDMEKNKFKDFNGLANWDVSQRKKLLDRPESWNWEARTCDRPDKKTTEIAWNFSKTLGMGIISSNFLKITRTNKSIDKLMKDEKQDKTVQNVYTMIDDDAGRKGGVARSGLFLI